MSTDREPNPFRAPAADGGGIPPQAGPPAGPPPPPAWQQPGGYPEAPATWAGRQPHPGGYGPQPAAYGYGPHAGPYGTHTGPYGPYPGYGIPGAPPRNSQGTMALVLGIIGAVLGITVILGPAGLVLGVLAVICGSIGVRRVRRGEATNRGVALGGLWTGVGATLLSAVTTVVMVMEPGGFVPVESGAGSSRMAEAGQQVRYADGLTVTFAEPEDAGDGTFVLTATLDNGSPDPVRLTDGDFFAFADGEELSSRDIRREDPSDMRRLPAGASVTVAHTVTVPADTWFLQVDFAPGWDHDFAFWEFALPLDRSAEPDHTTDV